ncbi:MFS transporter [Caenimonas soli]|uniref:MFS transporter n=1 Tax=Caenimonas soli TaxID=2735555 RepID=UPI0015556B18|nr:MFS transporter [Caenimonas soli]NPC58873.1 MFS transporter [Caenimonas soli]
MTDTKAARAALFRDRNFFWLTSGAAVSMLGDQFTLIALPWLVLKMTGDTLVLGTVLALISVPRALFILVGGAMVDRHSPKQVLMWTKHVNAVLLGLLAAGVFSGALTLPVIYALSLGIGVATAFSIPSATAMLPHAVRPEHLGGANSVMLGLRQFSMFLGPLLAGLLIALFGDGGGTHMADAKGIAIAFAFDAFSFAASAWTLSHVVTRNANEGTQPAPVAVWTSIRQGLGYIGRDAELRTCYLYWAAVAILVMGPLHIALPVLASTQAGLGASALGLMLGAHGAGTLLGMGISGAKPQLRLGTLGTTMLVLDVVIGLLFMPMGHIGAAWQGALLMGTIGMLGGFMQVRVFTWLQRRLPPALLGRGMALFMFIFMGLVPMASAVTGWLLRSITLPQLFAASGALLVLTALVAAVGSPLRRINDRSAAQA